MNLLHKRVCVLGLGASGRAAARLAAERGASVVGLDLREDLEPIEGVQMATGPHERRHLLDADLVVVSPGVPSTQEDLRVAADAGVPVLGELAFAWSQFSRVPTVAITGTNGKSTVTWLAGQLLASAGRRPFVGGNLGKPLSDGVLDDEAYDCAVIEVSSYQLEWRAGFEPDVAVILNLTPDHLARHGDMEGYARAKARLFDGLAPGGLAVVPWSDALLNRVTYGRAPRRVWLGAQPGVTRHERTAHVRLADRHGTFDLSDVSLVGAHNLDNVATALLLCMALGVSDDALTGGVAALRPLAHRMELVAEHEGVQFINDSKATNIDATRVGVTGMDRPAVVLLGGQAKGDGFSALAPLLVEQRGVVTFGASGPAIRDELEAAGLEVACCTSMEEAVNLARSMAQPGDAVLLSPGCASFDAYRNFEHRGDAFREVVT